MNKNFTWIKDYWERGQYLLALSVVFGRMPNYTWDFLFGDYDAGFEKFGEWSFKPNHPMFFRTIWREPFHFLGGVFLTLPFFLSPKISMIVSGQVALGYWLSEFWGDARGNPDLKNMIDWLAWVSGSACISLASFGVFASDHLK